MRASLALLLMSSLGCTPIGELVLEGSPNPDSLDFGPASPGSVWTKSALVKSRHGEPLTMLATVTNPVFEVSLPEGPALPPGETREVIVSYRPTAGFTGREEGTLTITTEVPELSATLQVSGYPTEPDCTVPATLDFGAVTTGDTATLELPLVNATPYDAVAVVSGGPMSPFSSEGGGFISLAPGGSRTVTLSFSPTDARDYTGTISVTRHQQLCSEQPIALLGTGVGATLTWAPATLTFSDVPSGTTARQTITFTNRRFVPVTLGPLAIREVASVNSPFAVSAPSLVVPAATRTSAGEIAPGFASLEVTFTPTTTGLRAALLSANVSETSAQATISVNLRGNGVP